MGWYSYDNGHEKKIAVQKKINALRKKGEAFEAVTVAGKGNKISTSFWGQSWCRHLESFSDYDSRLPRGRSYLRGGNVYNLLIEPGKIHASVAGSYLYDTSISIKPMAKAEWKDLVKRCGGQVGSLLDLLAGRIGEDTLHVLTDRETGLFPKPRQISFDCNCPDWADMCKHVAAVLYGVGVKLDSEPELLFTLRAVDKNDLLGDARSTAIDGLAGPAIASDDPLADADLSALFGIDLGDNSSLVNENADSSPVKKAAKKAAKKKATVPSKKAVKKAARKSAKKT